jgi:hypothetical protein
MKEERTAVSRGVFATAGARSRAAKASLSSFSTGSSDAVANTPRLTVPYWSFVALGPIEASPRFGLVARHLNFIEG